MHSVDGNRDRDGEGELDDKEKYDGLVVAAGLGGEAGKRPVLLLLAGMPLDTRVKVGRAVEVEEE